MSEQYDISMKITKISGCLRDGFLHSILFTLTSEDGTELDLGLDGEETEDACGNLDITGDKVTNMVIYYDNYINGIKFSFDTDYEAITGINDPRDFESNLFFDEESYEFIGFKGSTLDGRLHSLQSIVLNSTCVSEAEKAS